MSFSLSLLGGVSLAGEHGPLDGPPVQRHRLALLALLATSRSVGRDKVLGWLWPERDGDRARRLLNQALHALRRALGANAILSTGDELQLNHAVLSCDVVAFDEALACGDLRRAVAHYGGPFLDGFFLADAPEFEHWVERERDRLAAACAKALEALAEAVGGAGDARAAVEWWQRRAALDPYDSRVAVRLMQALEQAGNRAGAVQHGLLHQQRLRQELEIEPAPDVKALMERLQGEPVLGSGRPKRVASRAATAPDAKQAIVEPIAPAAGAGRLRGRLVGVLALLLVIVAGAAVWLGSWENRAARATVPGSVDEIAQAIARELQRRERGDTTRTLPLHGTRSIPAYEFFLRGSDPALLRSDSGAHRGLEYFERAVALDPNFAAAWAGVAAMTLRTAGTGAAAAKAHARAEATARKAVALDDSLADAHSVLGLLGSMAYDLPAAERHFARALELDPTRARTREWFATFYVAAGRPRDALAQAESALALDPLSPSAAAEVARALLANNRCDEALQRLAPIRAVDPPLLRVAPIAAQCHVRMGMWRVAMDDLRPQARRGEPLAMAMLGYMLGRTGDRDGAHAVQDTLLEAWRHRSMGAYYLAFVPTALGDHDQAFSWLDRSVRDGSLGVSTGMGLGLAGLLAEDLGADPRWGQLRKRLGLENR